MNRHTLETLPAWFHNGAMVKVVTNIHDHGFKIGAVILLGVDHEYIREGVLRNAIMSGTSWYTGSYWVHPDEVVPIEAPSVEELLG